MLTLSVISSATVCSYQKLSSVANANILVHDENKNAEIVNCEIMMV